MEVCNHTARGGPPLAKSISVKELDIKIKSDLSFQSHTGSSVPKELQRVGELFRGFHCEQVSFKKGIYHIYTSYHIFYEQTYIRDALRTKYYLVVSSVSKLTAGKVCHLLCVILNRCQHF